MLLIFFGILIFSSGSTSSQFINVDDYIDVVTAYYRHRNTRIVTHFTCFSQRKARIFFFRHKSQWIRLVEFIKKIQKFSKINLIL